jgi:hypothetical protein
MTDKPKQTPPKAPRHRSPNYPAIGLNDALKRAQVLGDQGGAKHAIPLTVAFDLWKYKSGAGNQVAAALKAFGFARIEGKTDKRAVRLTEAARRILLNAPDREQLLKEAALTPSLHAELWKKYDGDPPADSVIKNYLLVDRDFNQNFVDSFISQFRNTIAFAGLGEGDKIPSEDEADEGESDENGKDGLESEEAMLDRTIKKEDKGSPFNPTQKGQLPFPLYLSKTQKATLYVPASLTRKEYDLLKKQIENSLTVMEATILSDDDPADPPKN